MRFLPIPTGGKLPKWSTFLKKNIFSLPTGHEGPFWSKVLRKIFLSLSIAHEPSSGPHFPDFFLSTTHWRVLPVLNENFWKFLRSIPTGQKSPFWSKESDTFFSRYSLEGNGLFGQKVLTIFSLQYPLDISGRFKRKNFKLSFLSTHWTKTSVWPKDVEDFSFQYPTDTRCRFGLKNRRIFSFTTQRTWASVLAKGSWNFFLSSTSLTKKAVWPKENEKSPRKFSEGSRKIHITVL